MTPRKRSNISKQLRCVSLGKMTREEFMDNVSHNFGCVGRKEFHNNKVTIHCDFDKTTQQYSFIPIIKTKDMNRMRINHDNNILSQLNQLFNFNHIQL